VVAAGAQTIKGYDADTGKELWTVRGLVEQCIPSPVAKGDRVYTLLGNNSDTLAIRLDGGAGDRTEAHVAWKARSRGSWIPSPVCLGDYFYYVDEGGWGNCLEAATGRPVWRERLQGKFKASPVAGDGKVYFVSEAGVVTVVRAGPKFKVLARNDLGEGIEASPAVSQGRLFLRGDKHLYCIGRSQ
jgi:outer membrane protein assembly factor BamB